jgi:hypothetical protein
MDLEFGRPDHRRNIHTVARSAIIARVQEGPAARPLSRKSGFVPLESLRPTQAAVGMRAVAAKRQNIERRLDHPKNIRKFLLKRPIPTVLGPNQRFYMIDHHHLGLALTQVDVGGAYIEVIDDLSRLSPRAFWTRMEQQGQVYPYDETGQRIPISWLPKRLSALRHDPFRDLASSVRDLGGFDKSEEPFAEFLWASFFRQRIAYATVASRYDSAVQRAIGLASSRAASKLPGFIGHA